METALTPPSPDRWDAVVIGAGVAGAALALRLASLSPRPERILLVERSAWPRPKVCGCCLNRDAVASLQDLGVSKPLLHESLPLDTVLLHRRGRSVPLPYPGGLCIARSRLDALLVSAALRLGVIFRPECSASVLPAEPGSDRRILLRARKDSDVVNARIVIAADGLAGSSLARIPALSAHASPSSWFGVGASIADSTSIGPRAIHMHLGAYGYVGLVRLDASTINLAAALDPLQAKRVGVPERLIGSILRSGREPSPLNPACLPLNHLRGTPLLTRRRRAVAEPGLLIVGDAAGYTEPFTGDGMALALASAIAAADLIAETLRSHNSIASADLACRWQSRHDHAARSLSRRSRPLVTLIHHPALATAAFGLVRVSPLFRSMAARCVRTLSAPLAETGSSCRGAAA